MSIPNISASTFSYQLRDALVALLVNAGGTLATLKNVRPSAQIEAMQDGENVAAAVQIKDWKQEFYSQHRRKVLTRIDIIFAARSVDTPTRFANLDDASTLLEPMIDAGDGINGIMPALNAAGISLGFAWESNVESVEYPYQIREGEQQEVWAFAVIHFTATTFVSFY